ncbi:MAG: nitrate reductase cytochrome c-type subunit [Pontiella sp.]
MSSKQASPLSGFLIISGFTVIGVSVLFGVRAKLQASDSHTEHHPAWASAHAAPHAVVHEEVRPPRTALTAHNSAPRPGAKVRTLQEYYSRRAYPGAPPIIPHAIEFDGVINDDCLSCHKDGGFVPEYNAYTPITGHPEFDNCRQCHVPKNVETDFVATEWQMPALPKRGRQAIPGGPLQIPHSLHFRSNCKVCHVGPQAVVEIRSSHPERENCLQCHVVDRDIPLFKSRIDTRVELAHVEK